MTLLNQDKFPNNASPPRNKVLKIKFGDVKSSREIILNGVDNAHESHNNESKNNCENEVNKFLVAAPLQPLCNMNIKEEGISSETSAINMETEENTVSSSEKDDCSSPELILFSKIEKSKFPLVLIEALSKEVIETHSKPSLSRRGRGNRKRKNDLASIDLTDVSDAEVLDNDVTKDSQVDDVKEIKQEIDDVRMANQVDGMNSTNDVDDVVKTLDQDDIQMTNQDVTLDVTIDVNEEFSRIQMSKFPLVVLQPLSEKELKKWRGNSPSPPKGDGNIEVIFIKQEIIETESTCDEDEEEKRLFQRIQNSKYPIVLLRDWKKTCASDPESSLTEDNASCLIVYKCFSCTYVTERRNNAKRHSLIHSDAKVYKCLECDFETNVKQSILNHLNIKHAVEGGDIEKNSSIMIQDAQNIMDMTFSKYIATVFKCSVCYFETKNQGNIETHLLDHSNKKSTDKYKSSNSETVGKDIVKANSSSKSDKTKKTSMNDYSDKIQKIFAILFQCCVCNYETKSFAYARKHSLTHMDFRLYKCFKCEFGANQKGKVIIHLLKVHGMERIKAAKRNMILNQDPDWAIKKNFSQFISKVLKCSECSYETEDAASAERHLSFHSESQSEMYQCWECEYESSCKETLQKHLQEQHPHLKGFEDEKSKEDESITEIIIKMFHCSVCSLKTKNRHHAIRHSLVHADFKLYKCSQCDFDTNRKVQMKEHVEKEHVILFSDSKNGFEVLPEVSTIIEEFFAKTVIEFLRRYYQCSLCDYESEAKSDVETHFLMHSDGKLYKCSDCMYTSNVKSNLKRHMAKHIVKVLPVLPSNSDTEGEEKDKEEENGIQQEEAQSDTELPRSKRRRKCSYASNPEIGESDVNSSENESGSSNKLFCSKCRFETEDEGTLATHSCNNIANEKPQLRCSECKFETFYRQSLTKHINKVHSDSKLLTCLKCNFETKNEQKFEQHLCKVTDKKSNLRSYRSKSELLKCSKCFFETANKNCLKSHIEQTHCGVKRFKCSECIYETYSNSHLKKHMEVIHSDVLPQVFKCSDCDFETEKKGNYIMHLRTHSRDTEMIVKCNSEINERYLPQIGNQFIISTDSHKGGQGYKSGNMFRCSECTYETHAKANLTRHMKNHSSVKLFKCPDCDFAAGDSVSYTSHINSHVTSLSRVEISNIDDISDINLDNFVMDEETEQPSYVSETEHVRSIQNDGESEEIHEEVKHNEGEGVNDFTSFENIVNVEDLENIEELELEELEDAPPLAEEEAVAPMEEETYDETAFADDIGSPNEENGVATQQDDVRTDFENAEGLNVFVGLPNVDFVACDVIETELESNE